MVIIDDVSLLVDSFLELSTDPIKDAKRVDAVTGE